LTGGSPHGTLRKRAGKKRVRQSGDEKEKGGKGKTWKKKNEKGGRSERKKLASHSVIGGEVSWARGGVDKGETEIRKQAQRKKKLNGAKERSN